MNNPQILSLLRNILQYGGGFISGAGWMTTTEWDTSVGIIMSLIGLAWSMWDRRAAKLAADAAKQPGVSVAVPDSETARAVIKAGAPANSVSVSGGL